MAAGQLIAEWFVILAFCSGDPQACQTYAWPMPLSTQLACTGFGARLADIYKANWFTCHDGMPVGVPLLPAPQEEVAIWH